jgi:hypothetical protein
MHPILNKIKCKVEDQLLQAKLTIKKQKLNERNKTLKMKCNNLDKT